MANKTTYGLTWARSANGGKDCPAPEEWPVATGYQATVQGGTAVDLNVGDVVKRTSGGTLALAEGTEITSYPSPAADIAVGVIVGFKPYFDGQVMVPTNFLPGGTVYGTNLSRQSKALVVPLQNGVWQLDCDENSTAATIAAYQLLVGENVDFVNKNVAVAPNGVVKADPQIDISTHAVTVTLRFRIYGLAQSLDSDNATETHFKLLLVANSYADAPNTVGV